MSENYSDAELEAFLDESLDAHRASEIESAAREDQDLLKRMAAINRRRDAGVHSLGAIWRRFQVGVPTKEEMGEFLLGVMDEQHSQYIDFRLNILKCPFTASIKKELEASQQPDTPMENQKLFDSIYQSSAGMLKKSKD